MPGNPARTNLLYRNNGNGTFTERGAEAGLNDNAQSWSTAFEDFDNDGDQDVVAVSCLPSLLFPQREQLQLPSVVLLEQKAKSQFVTHVLEAASCDHFSCDAGDWDNDGHVDLAVSNFAWNGARPMADAAIMWKNLGPPAVEAK